MLSSIHPLGERGRHNRFSITASAHLVGSTVGGALAGLVAGVVGWSAGGDAWMPLAVGAAAAAIVLDAAGIPVPSSHRQVNERWIDQFRGTVYGAGFGVQLGLGVVTIVTTWLVPAMLAIAVFTGSWWAGLVIGGWFGLARGAMVFTTLRVDTVGKLQLHHRRLHEHRLTARRAMLLLVAVVGTTTALVG